MKICKYYSLDECKVQDLVFRKLDELMDDTKIEYEVVETDVIKIKDIGLGVKEKKEIIFFFRDKDVIEYPDYNEEDEEEDEEDEEDDYEF